MDFSENRTALTTRHPWEMARFEFFERILRDHQLLTPEKRFLDVGAGDGWFSAQLFGAERSLGPIVCWDTAYDPARADLPRHPHLRPVAERPRDGFDVLLLLDVLEHIPQDAEFLHSLVNENLKPRGYVLISVPCWSWLFSGHDRRLQHVRRYTPAACRHLIESSGLAVVQSGGLFHSLLPVRAALVGLERLFKRDRPHGHVGEAHFAGPLHAALMALLRTDNYFARKLSQKHYTFPGLSWWALCREQ